MFAWGRNVFGQLGLNDTKQRNLPCKLRTLKNAKVCYAACGEEFTVFLTLVGFIIKLNCILFEVEKCSFLQKITPWETFFQDGGVFTCGAGMYGQLGHGNNMNEILPRQIMELMGSTVTQVSYLS